MMFRFLRRFSRFLHCEKAVSALEYAVLAGVVLAGIGTAIAAFSDTVAVAIGDLGDAVTAGTGTVEEGDLERQQLTQFGPAASALIAGIA